MTIEAVVIEIEASVVTATTEAPGAVAMVQGVPPMALAPPSRLRPQQRPQQRPQSQLASVVRGGARSSGQPADVEEQLNAAVAFSMISIVLPGTAAQFCGNPSQSALVRGPPENVSSLGQCACGRSVAWIVVG